MVRTRGTAALFSIIVGVSLFGLCFGASLVNILFEGPPYPSSSDQTVSLILIPAIVAIVAGVASRRWNVNSKRSTEETPADSYIDEDADEHTPEPLRDE